MARSPDERTLTIRPPVWLPILVVLIAGCAYVAGKIIEVRGYDPVQVSVAGEGKVFASPDIAELSFGVQTGRQPTAQRAIENLRVDMDAILAAVKALGIEERDIRTESLWLNPSFDWVEGRQIDRGFEASQSLRVKVRDLNLIGQVLTDATAAGANQAGGVNFTIDDPDELRSQARELAIADAQEKARKLAAQLGRTLKRMKAFAESDSGMVPPMAMERAMMGDAMGGGGPVPVPSGEQEINVGVVLTYELE